MATGRLAARALWPTDSRDNARVILLIGVAIAVFVVPDEWTLPVIGIAAVLEVTETIVTYRLSHRWRPKAGVEALIGEVGRATTTCRPDGRVRIRGESWRARCTAGADAGDRVRVVGRDGLTLLIEPAG